MLKRISALLAAVLLALLAPLTAVASRGEHTFSSDFGYQLLLPEGWVRLDPRTLAAILGRYGEETAALKGFSQAKLDIYKKSRSELYVSADCAATVKVTLLDAAFITTPEQLSTYEKTIAAALEKSGARDVQVKGVTAQGAQSFYRVDYARGDSPPMSTYLLIAGSTLYCITFAGMAEDQASAVLTGFALFDPRPAQTQARPSRANPHP